MHIGLRSAFLSARTSITFTNKNSSEDETVSSASEMLSPVWDPAKYLSDKRPENGCVLHKIVTVVLRLMRSDYIA